MKQLGILVLQAVRHTKNNALTNVAHDKAGQHEYEPSNNDVPLSDFGFVHNWWWPSGLTKKAEPPPTRDVNRDSGTASANGGWLRRLVRHQRREIHNKIRQIQMLANWQAAALARRINRRELNPD